MPTRTRDTSALVEVTRPSLPAVHSIESGRSYQLDQLIGKGGFGEIYLATPISSARTLPPDRTRPSGVKTMLSYVKAVSTGGLPARVCVKISYVLAAWLREAYFAQLLDRVPRALRIFDRFVEPEATRMRYCLVMEYAEHGDLGAWLELNGAQGERFVRHEIAAILETLDVLHRGQAMHRDLTPFNVFVCEGERLKLGDFGIATHQANRRGVTADAFNPLNAPTEIAWGKVRKWQQKDDIYQVGQLIAMLLRGDIHKPMRSKDVRKLPCSDHLKEVIHRCLAAREKRYQAAGELIAALRHRPRELKSGRVKSLKGCRLSFTGFLSKPREVAIAAARRAGALVQAKPGPSTDVLVRGRPNALQVAGKAGGTKLLEIKRLAAKGYRVTIIGEAQFWKLVTPGKSSRQTTPAKRRS